jgi:hypothetical protein
LQPPPNHAARKSKISCTEGVPVPLPPTCAYGLPANQALRKSKMSWTVMLWLLLKSP